MSTTNSTNFSRFSSNIAEDGAIAVFDVLPTSNIGDPNTGDSNEYANDITSMLGTIDWLSPDIRFFEIPSSHCSKRANAYYLNKTQSTRSTEFPSVSGIPMNYGGAPLARYKALSSDIVGAEPFMLVPSMGMGSDHPDRARTFEAWLGIEPYAEATQLNVLPNHISNMDLNANFEITGGTVTEETDPNIKWPALSSATKTQRLSANAELGFVNPHSFVVNGGRKYTFGISMSGTVGTLVNFTFRITTGSGITKEYIRTVTLTAVDSFNNLFGIDFSIGNWGFYTFDFIVDETLAENNCDLYISGDAEILISEAYLNDSTGGTLETVAKEEPIIQFGGPDGTKIVLSADADFLYLSGYGETSSFQVGEWGRPVYLACVDNEGTFEVYINASLVMSVSKTSKSETYGDVKGDWVLFTLSRTFKYIDLSTIAIYNSILGEDIQKIHYLFGYGPKYNDVVDRNPHEEIYVADGSATNFSSNILFPQTTSFNIGISDGVDVSNQLSLPEYELPRIIGGSYDEVEYFDLDFDGFGAETFKFPTGSEAVLNPVEIINDAQYLFVMASPFDDPSLPSASNTNGLIFQVSSTNIDLGCDFTFSDVGGGEILVEGVIFGEATPFFSTQMSRKNLLLVLNVAELRNHPNRDVAVIFNDPNIVYRFGDSCLYTYIAAATRDSVVGNGVVDKDNDFPAVSVIETTDDGTTDILILGNVTYAIYPSPSTEARQTLEIAASGIWRVSIPLTSFSTFINGNPDIDFIVYSDQSQAPQLITSLRTDLKSYDDVRDYVEQDLIDRDITGDPAIAEYSDLQAEADANSLSYAQIAVDISSVAASLGRFANKSIQTFVTLDSQVRWPNKKYSDLTVENANTSGYIDFDRSSNSVLTTKWEIFDGFAIRIPKKIDLYKYDLGLTVHLSTLSLRKRRPTFRRADLFGIASGDRPSNQISVGSGSSIIVGNSKDVNINRPFSTHLVTETLPSNYMPKEHGFYPHGYSENDDIAQIYFYLTQDDVIKGMSFYINWRSETFRTVPDPLTGLYEEIIGQLKYLDQLNNEYYIDIVAETIDPTTTPWLANLKTNFADATIYIDGEANTIIEAGKWHQVYIDLLDNGRTQLSDAGRKTIFLHQNSFAVLNYITSNSVKVSPLNLHAARFGLTDQSIFADDFSSGLHYGTSDSLSLLEDSEIVTVFNPPDQDSADNGPNASRRVDLDNKVWYNL